MNKKEGFNREEAYKKSLEVLKDCSTKHGFLGSVVDKDNYSRVWGRDSMVCSLAGLLSGEKDLVEQAKRSLITLLNYQLKHGQIASNVDAENGKVSYGGAAGRVDASLWFLIGFSQYVKRTGDIKFLKKYYGKYKKTADLVHLYEFNEKGLIYIPKGGDWADEYIQEGYVLYDELLYYKAVKEHIDLRKILGKDAGDLKKRLGKIRKVIETNYWIKKKNLSSGSIYQEVLYKKAIKAGACGKGYMMPYFSPSGYDYYFDGFANSLALNFGFISGKDRKSFLKYVKKNFSRKTKYLIPSFFPVIKKGSRKWGELKDNYIFRFRNKPYQYHNGGLWPVITGFFAAGLRDADIVLAGSYLDGINEANFKAKKGEWGFCEFINGGNFKPNGTPKQAWSAAAGIIANNIVVLGGKLFV